MQNKEEFDFFLYQMLENAVKNFKKTEQYTLLKEKLEQMNRNYKTILSE